MLKRTAGNGKRLLTGFSHGAAGMALSLLKLTDLSAEERFYQTAQALMEYERNMFSKENQNWPDLRDLESGINSGQNTPDDQVRFMTTWCHGAPGIGLGRLASLKYIDNSTIRDEISIALRTTITQGFGLTHSLCHGDLGNLDVLLLATQILDNTQYYEQVERLIPMILDSIDTYGWITGIPTGIESPGLMTGIAGIGYELLRLAEAEKVPSVLLLAPPNTTF